MLPPKIDCDIKEHVNRVITVWVRVRLAKQGLLAEGSIRFSFSAVDGTFCINYKALMAPEQALDSLEVDIRELNSFEELQR